MDAGASWQISTNWYDGGTGTTTVHADKHCLAYNKLTNALFETCDGGVYKTYEPIAGGWINLCSGLNITEFYRNAVDNGATFAIGGAQDNGTKMIDVTGSSDLFGGDGMQPLINYGDPNNVFYVSYQNGNIYITRDGGANYTSITDTLHEGGGWISPYVLHPTDTATLLLGFKNVYLSNNIGGSWTPISPVFDSNSYINRVQIANSNPNYIYVEYDDYSVWNSAVKFTTNFGATWNTLPLPFTNFITDLKINPRNENQIFVTVSGYSASDKVYKYDLSTMSWTNMAGSLPNMPVECVLIDTNTLTTYIGTDGSVFYRDTTMSDWALYNNHLPTVHVNQLNINYTTGDIWAATYGRGMWKSNKNNVPSSVAKQELTAAIINIAPNPSHDNFVISTNSQDLKSGIVTVQLTGVDGKQALLTSTTFAATGNIKIDTKGLPAGFYICEVRNENTVVRSRVVIY